MIEPAAVAATPTSGATAGRVRYKTAYDRPLVLATLILVCLGLVMVESASIALAASQTGNAFYFLNRQLVFVAMGVGLGFLVLRIELKTWLSLGGVCLLMNLVLLGVILIPGVGHEANGSSRWLYIGPVGFQFSELVKLNLIIYLSGYLVRHAEEVKRQFSGFAKPMLLLGCMMALLLLEPDFGATVVVSATALGMIFLAGARLWQFAVILIGVGAGFVGLVFASTYRLKRVTAFLNPWAHPFDSGYQLTQSLIAFGRGGWFGVGLGSSIQKLFYLPEAHTDFLFAVIAEELGLLGVLAVIGVFILFVWRAFVIARTAHARGLLFGAYIAYGIGIWIGIQAMINMGVNAGLLPTKGLTLPLMSSGGSSLLVNLVAVAFLLRIDYENRTAEGARL